MAHKNGLLKRDELHTREGATQTNFAPYGWEYLTGFFFRYHPVRFVSVGCVDWAGCKGTRVLVGVQLLDLLQLVSSGVIGRKYVGRGTSGFG